MLKQKNPDDFLSNVYIIMSVQRARLNFLLKLISYYYVYSNFELTCYLCINIPCLRIAGLWLNEIVQNVLNIIENVYVILNMKARNN